MTDEERKASLSDAADETRRVVSDFAKRGEEAMKDLNQRGKVVLAKIKEFDRNNPERRARASGRYLARLSLVWGVLSLIGAVIMMFQRNCVDRSDWSDSCYSYEYPFVTWGLVSLLVNLMVSSFFYTFGTYVEARVTQESK